VEETSLEMVQPAQKYILALLTADCLLLTEKVCRTFTQKPKISSANVSMRINKASKEPVDQSWRSSYVFVAVLQQMTPQPSG
jgi:hypothetical protein